MGLPWIELHTNLPRHPKSLALGLALSNPMAWTHMAALWLWCAENRPDGTFRGEVAGAMVEAAASWMGKPGAFVDAATAAGFLEKTEGGYIAASWVKRAAAHLAKRERDSARQRERYVKTSKRFESKKPKTSKVSPSENARRTDGEPTDNQAVSPGTVTLTPTPTHISPSEKEEGLPVLVGRAEVLRDLWNARAHPSLPRWEGMSKKRRAQADARVEEEARFSYWRDVIARINASQFCRGENDRGWRASPDWLLQPDTASRVLEGKYDGRAKTNPNARATQGDRVDANYRPPLTPDGDLDLMGVGS